MILKNTQIIWKLKAGTVLKYGPDLASLGETRSSEFLVKTEPETEVISKKDHIVEETSPLSVVSDVPVPATSNTSDISDEISVSTEKTVPLENEEIRSEQSYPESIKTNLVNPANSSPVVDGLALNIPSVAQPLGARWQSLPYRLRAKRADVFVDMQSSVDYLNSLVSFLNKKGLDVKEYNDEVHYLPSDIILADASRLIDAGTVLVLQRGKRYIWEALLKEFGARLNGK